MKKTYNFVKGIRKERKRIAIDTKNKSPNEIGVF
jgi:hypothetical protein